MIRSAVTTMTIIAFIAYPFVVFSAVGHVAPKILMAGVLSLLAVRISLKPWIKFSFPWKRWVIVGLLLGTAVAVLFVHDFRVRSVKLYPVVIDFCFFLLFFGSLFTHRPLVERIARAQHVDLTSFALIYTRRVTWVWAGVLLANTVIALVTALYASMKAWTLYNGFYSYLLIGSVFAIEYLVRRRVQHTQMLS